MIRFVEILSIKVNSIMDRILYLIFIFVILSYLSACNNPQPGAAKILEKAELIIEEHPDSALMLIDSIFYPEKSLNMKDYMRYLVRHVQARYKAYQPIAEDTLIFKARDYFTKKDRDPYITSLSYYYSGCVERERKEFEKAMGQYVEAERFALLTNDINLRGLIQYNMGDLLARQGNYLNAMDHYRNAESLYSKLPEELYEKVAISLSAIGRMHSYLGDKDNAFKYFIEGLEIANTYDDMSLQNQLAQNLSVAYREDRQYDKAELYLRQSLKLNTDSAEIPRYYLNFAKLYDKTGQSDSLNAYVDKLYESVNPNDISLFNLSVYEFLTSIENEKGNYELAFDHNKKHIKMLIEITNERNKQSIFDIQQKYNFELQQSQFDNQYNKVERYITLLIIVILIGALSFTLYTFQQRKKHIIALQKINTLKVMSDNLKLMYTDYESNKDMKIRNLMVDKFNTIKKVALLNNSIRENDSTKNVLKKLNEIVYGDNFKEEWLAILKVFNEINPDVYNNIKKRYHTLTKNELRIYILSYAKFNPKEIAVVLNLAYDTVLTLRSSIRKKIKMNSDGEKDLIHL